MKKAVEGGHTGALATTAPPMRSVALLRASGPAIVPE
jgi:hypothetical protein